MGLVISLCMWVSVIRHALQKQARNMMIRRAEKVLGSDSSVNRFAVLGDAHWDEKKAQIENKELQYPTYYLREYHGYPKGNLCWQAAYEAEVMSKVASIKAEPDANPKDAEDILREKYMTAILKNIGSEKTHEISKVLDIGCGIGNSTRSLQKTFSEAEITGLDLSPHFLTIAKYISKEKDQTKSNISWVHAPAESTPFPDNSFELVSFIGCSHEIPANVMPQIVAEGKRILKKQGIFVNIDVDPEKIKKMPRLVYTLFKSTEPDMDDYLSLDLKSLLREAGFNNIIEDKSVCRRAITIAFA